MRPPGARERIRDVARAELDILESWTDRRLRVELTAFVDVCSRLVFGDHPVAWVLRSYQLVPMTALTERYEDVPEARESTGAEIERVLEAFRTAAPWPLSTA